MDYQKIMNSLGNTNNQPPKFRADSWVEINDESRGTHNSKKIRFKTVLLKSSICDYSDVPILVKRTIIIVEEEDVEERAANRNNKKLILKLFVLSINCISEINNIQKSIKSNILMS